MSNPHSTQNSAEESPVDLTAFDVSYAEATVRDTKPLPDAKYNVRIENVTLTRSPKGVSLLTWDLRILTGEFSNRHIFKNVAITNKSLPVIKRDLLTLGVALDKFSDLPDHLQSLVGKTLSATKRTKKDYVNVYFGKRKS